MSTNENVDFIKLISIGLLELDFTLNLNQRDLTEYSIDLENINSLNDCSYFLNFDYFSEIKHPLLQKITLSSKNNLINTLLFINKVFKKKSFIELMLFSEIEFNNEEYFMKNLLKYISEQNYLFILENKIFNIPSNLNFEIKFNGKIMKSYKFGQENLTNQKNKEKNFTIFEQLGYDFEGTHYMLLDLNDILFMSQNNLDLDSFTEFIKNLALTYPKLNLVVTYPDVIMRIKELSISFINSISEIISCTNIFILDKKEASALFNLLNELNEDPNENLKNFESKKSIELIFLKDIKTIRKNLPKIGIFFDEIHKISIIEQQSNSNLVLFHTDYEFANEIIPKKVSKIQQQDYKKLMTINYFYLKSIFLGGLFSRLFYKNSFKTCFTTGVETVKKIIDVLKNNQELPNDPSYYIVTIPTVKVNKEKTFKLKKEQHFVLDCVNVVNSKMHEYNPLHDNNLQLYFSSFKIKKHLQKLGFINKKGIILQDPDKKKFGIANNEKLIRTYEDEQKNLLKIRDENEKMKIQISTLFHNSHSNFQNIGLSDLEKISKVYNFNPISNKKLPSISPAKIRKSSIEGYNPIKTGMSLTSNLKKNLKPISKNKHLEVINKIEEDIKSKSKGTEENPFYHSEPNPDVIYKDNEDYKEEYNKTKFSKACENSKKNLDVFNNKNSKNTIENNSMFEKFDKKFSSSQNNFNSNSNYNNANVNVKKNNTFQPETAAYSTNKRSIISPEIDFKAFKSK